MSKEHTPGPWGCIDTSNHSHDYRLTRPDGKPLPLHVEANDHSEQRANARLIAAAPEMLAALEQADVAMSAIWLGLPDPGLVAAQPFVDAQTAIRAAITAAKGQ